MKQQPISELKAMFLSRPKSVSHGWKPLGSSLAGAIAASLLFSQQPIRAQPISPDGTLGAESSVVAPNVEIRGTDSDRIDGGARRGTNLFHSFQEFNVETGRGVYFSNPAGIDNILTRVTGTNLSNIDGVLGVLGEANLFLLNPNGLVFGSGARLDINGSFVGSTAESALFAEYEFSAIDPSAPPMLTLNVPIGLQVGENSGEIVVRSQPQEMTGGEFAELADIGGLRVPAGEMLALVGGGIRFEAGQIQAPGAEVWLGGLAVAGVVDLDAGMAIGFPEGVARANLALIDGAQINVEGDGGGSVALAAGNLSLQESQILAGIAVGSTGGNAAGDITVDATGAVVLEASEIINGIVGIGDGGGVRIRGNTLALTAGTEVSTGIESEGVGETGAVRVRVTESITLQGALSSGQPSFIGSVVLPGAEGSLGETVITANSLALFDGTSIGSITAGAVDSGAVRIQVTDFISLQGESTFGTPGGIISLVGPGSEGDSGGISIATGSLFLSDAAMVNASTFGSGGAGAIEIRASDSVVLEGGALGQVSDSPSSIVSSVFPGAVGSSQGIFIEAGSVSLTDGAIVTASTFGEGDAGPIQIQATDSVTLQGQSSLGFSSISSTVELGAEGNSQGIILETGSLSLIDGAFINTTTQGIGDAGAIQIQATDFVVLQENSGLGEPSGILSSVLLGATGDSGGIAIATANLSLEDGAALVASTFGNGDAGAIQIQATDSITLQGGSNFTPSSSILSTVGVVGEGASQGIEITTGRLALMDGGTISATTLGDGDAGAIQIQATDSVALQGESSLGPSSITSEVLPGATGNSQGIAIATGSLSLQEGASLSASTLGAGSSGAIAIRAADTIVLQGESSQGLPSSVLSIVGIEALGSSQGITIETSSLSLSSGNLISTSTLGTGDAGAIQIQATDSITLQGESSPGLSSSISSSVGPEAVGNSQGIAIATPLLTLLDGSFISANTLGSGNAGPIAVAPPTASPNLEIDFGTGGFISTQTAGSGTGGEIALSAPQAITIGGQGNITASTTAGSTGTSGNIFLNAEAIAIDNTAIAVNSQGASPGGNLAITAGDLDLERSEITATTASTNGGNITLDLEGVLFLRDESLISTTAGTAAAGGNGGTIEIDSLFIVAFPADGPAGSDITANAFEGEGGSINIASEGLFGIEFQDDLALPSESPSNDITVTSTFGNPGNLTVNSPEVNPASALVDLAETGAEVAVRDGCQVGAAGSLTFYQIGRGGLPLNGSAAAETSAVLGSWTPIEAEAAAGLPSTGPHSSHSPRALLRIVPAGDARNLQPQQLASVRFVPACRAGKAPTSTPARLEE